MAVAGLTESTVESAALAWLEPLGWQVRRGPGIAPGEPSAERASYGEVLLVGRLRAALERINPNIAEDTREV